MPKPLIDEIASAAAGDRPGPARPCRTGRTANRNLALALSGALFCMAAQAQEPNPDSLRIITSPSTDSELSVAAGQAVIKELYNRCGLQVRYLNAPAARAMRIAENGQADGELARIPLAISPNAPLVPLAPPMDELHMVPVYLNPDLPSGREILAGTRIGYINGYRMVDSLLSPVAIRVPTSSTAKLIQLLELDRIDVALTLSWDAIAAANHNPDLQIGKPLVTSPLYHYVHESRTQDLPCLSTQLTQMQHSGDYNAIFNEALAQPFPETSMRPGGGRTP